jgi:integration host factor subunit alpha
MAGRTVTRAHLHAAAYQASEISEREASALVELVLAEITRALAKGEMVKLASFGTTGSP